jgi:hypothetical protein
MVGARRPAAEPQAVRWRRKQMARDRLNAWAELEYFDPVKVLRAAHEDGFNHKLASPIVVPSQFAPREFKRTAEALDAAAFACGLAARVPGVVVHLAEHEAQDHDFVLRFGVAGEPYYCPLQIKQLVSFETNPQATAENLLASLRKYVDSSDLVVAIKIDRLGIDPRSLNMPELAVAEVWFFGQLQPAGDNWFLYGDCCGTPEWFKFTLPTLKNAI